MFIGSYLVRKDFFFVGEINKRKKDFFSAASAEKKMKEERRKGIFRLYDLNQLPGTMVHDIRVLYCII